MAKEICIQMALRPLQCSMLHLESGSRERWFNRRAPLHPLEDMQERLISSLKALQVSKAILPHKHGVKREHKIVQLINYGADNSKQIITTFD